MRMRRVKDEGGGPNVRSIVCSASKAPKAHSTLCAHLLTRMHVQRAHVLNLGANERRRGTNGGRRQNGGVGTRRIEVGMEVHISRACRRLPSKLRLSPYWSCPFPTGRAPSVGYAVGPGPGRLEDIA